MLDGRKNSQIGLLAMNDIGLVQIRKTILPLHYF